MDRCPNTSYCFEMCSGACMTEKLAVPAPQGLVRGFHVRVRKWTTDVRDISVLDDYRGKFAALQKYLKDKEQRREAEASARWCEVRIGELLGPADRDHDRRKGAKSVATDLGRMERHDFRLLAEHCDVVARSIESGQTARRVILHAIADLRREAPSTSAVDTCTVEDLDALISAGRTFGTVYADPPWLYDNQGTRAATGNHYAGMTVAELCELPVGKLAAPDAHLHLWTTNAFLFECPRLFQAWGFEFRSSFVWVKDQIGIGNYWRNSHEFLLTAIRGNAKSFANKKLRSWLQCGRGRHSAKPDKVRDMLVKASPGPRLEMFGRRQVKGWTVWGNQIERDVFWQDAT